ncbi:MAG TPA: hypothetical protein VLR92_00465 [Blastocatellia bacterium]|nr:hypothetical protein [Blastocatellia bacterium]
MSNYRNHYDVSQTVDVTDPFAVKTEVKWIFLGLYPRASLSAVERAFDDVDALYHGNFSGYRACDTPFHDLQHVLDVALAMARLMNGYERNRTGSEPLGLQLFSLGIVAALFHDCGLVRTIDDREHSNGAELMQTRTSRAGTFVRKYLVEIGMSDTADLVPALLHFTGYELPVGRIELPTVRHRLLGSLLGSADIIAQMADRCYLEKCRDRLYPELVAGRVARNELPGGREQIVFSSGEDLVMKTPSFYVRAMRRLRNDLGNCYHFATYVFGGKDLYLKSIRRNIRFAQLLREGNDTSLLRRIAPCVNCRAVSDIRETYRHSSPA